MPYPEDLLQQIPGWAERGLSLQRRLLPLTAPIAQHSRWSEEERRTLGNLLTASARSTESALLLVAYQQMWDAEMVMRSVMEGTLKLLYLLQRPDAFATRFREYNHDLFDIGLLKGHGKATELLGALGQEGASAAWKPIRDMLLPDEECQRIRDQYPRESRRALEQRWGFTGMIGELCRSPDQLDSLRVLLHGYSVASHIQHADTIGVSLPFDRDGRTEERRDAIHAAHAVRLISDGLHCKLIRLLGGYCFLGLDTGAIAQAKREVAELVESFGPVYDDWLRIEYGDPSAK